ncbi:MAG TPA: hypothetical protein VFD32_14425 [Dehalococcoidia bacterium]|nr:hypothetical protein [Dehalococcoidia bacterium]
MADDQTAAQAWRPGLLHDLELALCRLEAERPAPSADADLIERWALVTTDVCSAIAALRASCAAPFGEEEPWPRHAPIQRAP